MEKKLTVRNLRISFRTSNGKVQAVRGINFDLAKGETLAIVGESGSGKSVTSKAILGILAGNSIIEGGEIIYDGKDLLKITEEDFHKIRGDKIAMIFQDPMSSLNPIVKIGRQLTEAMILKGKARQRESRTAFNSYLKRLNKEMIAACAPNDPAKAKELTEKCHNFDKFEYKHLDLEAAYNEAYDAASEAHGMIHTLALELEKSAAKDVNYRVNRVGHLAKTSIQDYVVHEKADQLKGCAARLKKELNAGKKNGNYTALCATLREIDRILEDALAKEEPNFFVMGYYLTFAGQPLPDMPVHELNAYLHQYLDDHFMLDFIADAKRGLINSAEASYQRKEEAIRALEENKPVFTRANLDRQECNAAYSKLAKIVGNSIDPMELIKDSEAYTFATALRTRIDQYFSPEEE